MRRARSHLCIQAALLILTAGRGAAAPGSGAPPNQETSPSSGGALRAEFDRTNAEHERARAAPGYRPREWADRYATILQQAERIEPDWRLRVGSLVNYHETLLRDGSPAAARSAVRPYVQRFRQAFLRAEPAAGDPEPRRQDCAAAAAAYGQVLNVLARQTGPRGADSRRFREEAPRLLRRCRQLAEQPDGRVLAQILTAFPSWQAACSYREGDTAAARAHFDEFERLVDRFLQDYWRRDDVETCLSILINWVGSGLGSYPEPGERSWRAEAAWRLRGRLRGFASQAETDRRPDRAALARWLLASLDRSNTERGVSDIEAVLYELHAAPDGTQRMPPGAARDRVEGRIADSLAAYSAFHGDLYSAREAWSDALRRAPTGGPSDAWQQRFQCLVGLGETNLRLGYIDAAYAPLCEAEALLVQHPGPWHAMYFAYDAVYGALGDYHRLTGNAGAARKYYERALAVPESLTPGAPANPRAAIYLMGLAELYRARSESRELSTDERRELLRLYGATFAERFHTADSWIPRIAWQAEAGRQELLGNYPAEGRALRQALGVATNRQSAADIALCRLELGQWMLRHGRRVEYPEARALFEQALGHGREGGDGFVQWQARLGRGTTRERLGDQRGALADYDAAAGIAGRLRERSALTPDQQARILPESAAITQRAALLLIRQGNPGAAYRRVQQYKAHELRKILFGGAPGEEALETPETRVMIRRVSDLRLRAAALAARRLDQRPGTRHTALDRQLRAARRDYRRAAAELRRLAATLPGDPVEPVAVERIARLAREQRLNLVDYLVTDGELVAFLFPGGGLRVVRVTVPRRKLAVAARSFVTLCADGGDTPGAIAPDEMYRWLVAPLQPYLLPGRPLVTVLDGPLHGVPFAAIPVPERGARRTGGTADASKRRFLIEGRAVTVSPSLDVLVRQFERMPIPGPAVVLVNSCGGGTGLVQVSRVAHSAYGPLPGSRAEGDTVARQLPGTLAAEYEADRRRWLAALRGKVAWFAGHAIYDPDDPENSALLLAGGRNGTDPFSVRDLLRLMSPPKEALELVVLSGCDTAGGAPGAGEGLVGLAWALQRGGARSVVGCNWEVDDRANGLLMAEFARNLHRLDRAEALRQAQMRVLATEGMSHPYYWAAPVLLGRMDALGPITTPPGPAIYLLSIPVALLVLGAGTIAFGRWRRKASATPMLAKSATS